MIRCFVIRVLVFALNVIVPRRCRYCGKRITKKRPAVAGGMHAVCGRMYKIESGGL